VANFAGRAMKQLLKAAAWRLIDPALARLALRIEHLGVLASRTDRERLERMLILPASTEIAPEAELFNHARRERFVIGEFGWIRGELYVTHPRGRLEIGHHVVIGRQTRIWASLDIRIGNFVKIAHAVDIHDSDSHPLDARLRKQDAEAFCERREPPDVFRIEAAPVRIEDGAWICFKASILKGVTVGRGAIVAAGAVVTKDVAPYTMVAGNPARFVKRLEATCVEAPRLARLAAELRD
jgi:acetyltransferase-like isoleucine patch superfamily enzyme